MKTTDKRKYWKGLLYSSTVIAMLGTPINALAAVTQNIQSGELTKEQQAVLNYQDAIANYEKAKEDYKTAKATYEGKIARYNELSQAAIDAKTEAENKAQELETAKAQYTPLKDEYEAAKAEFDQLKAAYEADEPEYLAQKSIYETAQAEYLALSAPYESALKDFNSKKVQYNTAMDEYEALQEEIRGTDGTGGLIGAFQTAKEAYDTALNAYETARTLYTDSKAAYEDAVSQYDTVLGQYQSRQGEYQELLTAYNQLKTTYTTNKAVYDEQLTELDRLKGLLETANNDYEAKKSAYIPLEAAYNQAIQENQTIIDNYNGEKKTYEDQVATLKAELVTYNEELAQYDTLRQAYNEAKSAYEESVTAYQNTTASLVTAKDQYETSKTAYEAAQAKYNGELGPYNELKEGYEKQLADFNTNLAAYNQKLTTYKQNYEAAKKILDSYDAGSVEYATAKAAYDENKRLYDETYPEYVATKLEADKVNEAYKEINKEFQNKTSEYQAIQNTYNRLKTQYESLTAQKIAQEEIYQSLETEYTNATTQYNEVKGQHDALLIETTKINQKIAEIQAAKILLDQAYQTAYEAIEAAKAQYEPANAAFMVARETYETAKIAYDEADKVAKDLAVTKGDLEEELQNLNDQFTVVDSELRDLNAQKDQLILEQGNLKAQEETAKGLLSDAEDKLGNADSTLATANEALAAAQMKLDAANNQLNNVLKPEFDAVEAAYLDLKKRYDEEVYPRYEEAYTLFGPLEVAYNDLAEKIRLMNEQLTDGSDFMAKYNAANTNYSELTALYAEAVAAYETAEREVENFNNNAEVEEIKALYDDARTKYDAVSTALAAAQKAVDDFNLNTTDAQEYKDVMAAYDAAVEAAGKIETVFDELNSIIDDYPVQNDYNIPTFVTGDEDTSGILLAYTDWKERYDAALTTAETTFDDVKKPIEEYQVAYKTYKQSGLASGLAENAVIDPDFLVKAEEAFTELKADPNIKKLEAYNEVVQIMRRIRIDYYVFVESILYADAVPEPNPNTRPITTSENSKQWNATATGIKNPPNTDFSVIGPEFADITNQETWDTMLETYQKRATSQLEEIQIWSDFAQKLIDPWSELKAEAYDKIESTLKDLNFNEIILFAPNANGSIGISAKTYYGDFKDSTESNYNELNRAFEEGCKNMNYTPETIWRGIALGTYSLPDVLSHGGLNLNTNEQSFAIEDIPQLMLMADLPLKPLNIQIPTVQIVEPKAPDQVTINIEELTPVIMTDISMDVGAPSMSETGVQLPNTPTLAGVTGVTAPNVVSWESRTPTETAKDLPTIEGHNGLDPLNPVTPEVPGENDAPELADPTIDDVVDPTEPIWDLEKPNSPDDLVEKAEDMEGVAIAPIEPEGAVEREEEVKVNFDAPKKPTVIQPVLPVKPDYVESPRPLTPPKEPASKTPEPEDGNPNDPGNPTGEDPKNPGGDNGNDSDVSGGTTSRNTPNTGGNRVSGGRVTNTNLPVTGSNGTLPKTNDINNPWYQALGASIIGALGLNGLYRRKKSKADKK